MLGSLITRPLRIATRSAQITIHCAHDAVDLAEGLVGLVAAKVMGHDGHDTGEGAQPSPEPAAWTGPAASSTSAPADRPPSRGATRTAARPAAPTAPSRSANGAGGATAAPPAREPSGPGAGTETTPGAGTETTPGAGPETTPGAGAETAPGPGPATPSAPAPSTSEGVDLEPSAPEPAHVDEGLELVEEVADPGAEEGAGAQLRIDEPWEGYRTMKAADVIDRLATASREELAAVELYELSGRNRKSVVAAAQRALKRASPPR